MSKPTRTNTSGVSCVGVFVSGENDFYLIGKACLSRVVPTYSNHFTESDYDRTN